MPEHANGTFAQEVVDEIVGYGPLEALLSDASVTEIMVNGPHQVYVEQAGKVYLSPTRFLNDAHVERIINRIVAPLGLQADASNPLVDARLPDGSRVNAIVRPCAIDGPTITIRKFPEDRLGINDLLRFGTLDEDMALILKAAVVSKLNILISGSTGSGRRPCSTSSPASSRRRAHRHHEDAAELRLHQPRRPAGARRAHDSGERTVSIRDLVSTPCACFPTASSSASAAAARRWTCCRR